MELLSSFDIKMISFRFHKSQEETCPVFSMDSATAAEAGSGSQRRGASGGSKPPVPGAPLTRGDPGVIQEDIAVYRYR
jgi:hypothetical protein